jgi:hypothetical protein
MADCVPALVKPDGRFFRLAPFVLSTLRSIAL